MHLLVTNHFNDAKNFKLLLLAAVAIVAVFAVNIYISNNVVSVVQSVLAAEMIIVLAFVSLTNFTRSNISS